MKKTIITTVLAFSAILFLIGTITFFYQDNLNKKQRNYLLAHGIKTTATVNHTEQQDIKKYKHYFGTGNRIGATQIASTYHLTFTYYHDSIARRKNKEIKLSNYIDGKKAKTALPKPKNRTRVTVVTEKDIYNSKKAGDPIDIIYLYHDPKSAHVLNHKGSITIPSFFLMGIITLLLFMGITYMLYYFRKTGKTF